MTFCRLLTLLATLTSIFTFNRLAHAAEPLQQTVLLRAGAYFSASKSFEPGNGIDLVYSVRPIPYAALEASIGYYRAESGTTAFLSAIPLTVSAKAILPVQYFNIYAAGGAGTYYKMAGGLDGLPNHSTELPSDHSEFSLGYHANAGVEYPATGGLTLFLDGKYVYVNQGKFRSYDNIKHGGAVLYGGFALLF